MIEPHELEAQLGDRRLRIIDASWYLPSAGRDPALEYSEGHLPGAVHLDLSTDLADREASTRNTVATPDALAHAFGNAGIHADDDVVIYDRLAGYSAGRIWWCLMLAGMRGASLLNGGYERWAAEGRPVTSELPSHAPKIFRPQPALRWLRNRRSVEENIESQEALLLDVRSAARFRGEAEEKTKHRGHIPGSINLPYGENFDRDPKRFCDPASLRARYEAVGINWQRPVITTCGSGVTASLACFALTWLGHPNVAVYDGSWAEWGNLDDAPIATGND